MKIPYIFPEHVMSHRLRHITCYLFLVGTLASCGGESSVDDVGGDGISPGGSGAPTPTITPTPPTGVTPTPGQVTPTPTPGQVTPTPTPGQVTPTPTPGQVTPTPTPGQVTPTPTPVTPAPTPIEITTVVYAINVGGNQAVAGDFTYSADEYFSGGTEGNTNNDIDGASVQEVYKTERWGDFSYSLPVDNGEYDVTLQFAEFYFNNVGERVLSVDVEDSRQISSLDIVREVGAGKVLDRELNNITVTDGTLDILFSSTQEFAKLSGIVVRSTTTITPTPPPTPGLDGAALFTSLGCTACHGNDGQQISQPIVFDNFTYETFLRKVDLTMPPSDPDVCNDECAEAVSSYAWSLRPQELSCDTEQVLPKRVRLLTKFEYVNTVNDLFGRNDAEALALGIGSDTVIRGFDNNADANRITSVRMDAYWTTAESIVNSANFAPWLTTNNCSQNDVASCFVENFGRDAFRRDLSNDEISDYKELFDEGADEEESARIVAQTMLVSSNFLYRTELGQNGRLTPFEIASLLSYTFWGTAPDSVLLNKAKTNGLSSAAQLSTEVRRLVADERAQKQFVHFGRQWLDITSVKSLDRDPQQFPAFTDDVASAMDEEVELFLAEVMLQDGYGMGDVLQSDFVFANQALSNFYGLEGANGSQMEKLVSDGLRGGVLSLGAVLANNAKFDDSNPITRGLLVRRNLLCQEFGAPPPVVGEVEPFDPTKPTRERFAAHTADPNCTSCHQYIDEVGFAFENYDGVGQYRISQGNNLAVDASGSISGLDILTGADTHSFSNLQDLSAILATDGLESTSACLVETFQRMMDGVAEPDSCATDNISTRWAAGSIKDLWIEMIVSQSFSQRQ